MPPTPPTNFIRPACRRCQCAPCLLGIVTAFPCPVSQLPPNSIRLVPGGHRPPLHTAVVPFRWGKMEVPEKPWLFGERRSQDTRGIFRLRKIKHGILCFDDAAPSTPRTNSIRLVGNGLCAVPSCRGRRPRRPAQIPYASSRAVTDRPYTQLSFLFVGANCVRP